MSSRVLRKLKGDDPLSEVNRALLAQPESEPKGDEEAGSGSGSGADASSGAGLAPRGGARPKQPYVNPFDLLGGGADSCSESEVKEDDDLGTDSSRLQRDDTKKRKKKKNRKKAAAGGTHAIPPSSGDNVKEDEIDRSVREVNKLLGKTVSASAPAASEASASARAHTHNMLLSVELKNLNPDYEMKRLFGSRVVQAETTRHHHHYHHRRGGAGPGAGGGRTRAPTRTTHWIVSPRPDWQVVGKTGLSMRFVDSDAKGNQFFSFEHSADYQKIQESFYAAVESNDPQFLIALVNEHPYHIDGLLQLSETCKMMEDIQLAKEMIERALYFMESAFHSLFNLSVGTCRLDYRRQQNRAFFLALFRHLTFVGSRACYRTSLEYCKLLLSLDPVADPVGILLLLDFYAIRAQEYAWFVRLYDAWNDTKNLDQLPNWAYSVALAHFYLAGANKSGDSEHMSRADELLQRALIMFPGVLTPLLDKCSIEPDAKVEQHKYFISAQSGQPRGLQLLMNLYVGRSFHLWKDPDLLPWLERNSHAVLVRLDAAAAVPASEDADYIRQCEERRKVRYQGAPRNVYRHVLMSDIKDAVTSLPVDLSSSPVLSYDPLPPTNSMDLYKPLGASSANALANANDNPFSLFFRSMLPDFNPNDPLTAEGAEGGGLGVRRQIEEALGPLMASMQDIFQGRQDAADSEGSTEGADGRGGENDPDWQ